MKDLNIIKDRSLEDIVIVDNSIVSFGFQLDNGVPISSFQSEDSQDQEMLYLLTYLEEIYHQKDVRKMNQKTFGLKDLALRIRLS